MLLLKEGRIISLMDCWAEFGGALLLSFKRQMILTSAGVSVDESPALVALL